MCNLHLVPNKLQKFLGNADVYLFLSEVGEVCLMMEFANLPKICISFLLAENICIVFQQTLSLDGMGLLEFD